MALPRHYRDPFSLPEYDSSRNRLRLGVKTLYGKTSEGTVRSTVIVDEEGRVAVVFPKVKPDGHALEVLESI